MKHLSPFKISGAQEFLVSYGDKFYAMKKQVLDPASSSCTDIFLLAHEDYSVSSFQMFYIFPWAQHPSVLAELFFVLCATGDIVES